MRVAFLMGLFPKDNRNEIIKNSRGPIQFAADALEWGYVKGISEQNIKCELFNAPFIGSYPKRYGKPFYTSYSNEKISKWVDLYEEVDKEVVWFVLRRYDSFDCV